jgi:uncharacterized protein
LENEMKRFSIIIGFLTLIIPITISQDFTKENKTFRKKINKEFKNPDESPLTKEDFETFKSLSFFPLNESFSVQAVLVINNLPQLFKMPTTTDRQPIYSTYGELIFTLNGTEYILQVYQNQDLLNKEGFEDYLFVPFTDETNGKETYGGGRYLDFRIPTTESVVVDFNKAYNPYCAYSDRYSCPKVPPINHLPIRVEAGVLKWDH